MDVKPISLTGHTVAPDQIELIRTHMTLLAETARKVSDTLPLEANAGDFIAVLENDRPTEERA